MPKLGIFRVLFGSLLSIDTFYSIQWFWQQTAKALIIMHECSLIWAFAVCTCPEDTFSWHGSVQHVCMKVCWSIDLKVTVYEDVCGCAPFADSALYSESVRHAFSMFATHIGNSGCWLWFIFAIHVCDTGLLFFCIIIIITLWVNSADNKLIFFLIFPENRDQHLIQMVSWGDTLPEMSNLFTGKIRKTFQNVIC